MPIKKKSIAMEKRKDWLRLFTSYATHENVFCLLQFHIVWESHLKDVLVIIKLGETSKLLKE